MGLNIPGPTFSGSSAEVGMVNFFTKNRVGMDLTFYSLAWYCQRLKTETHHNHKEAVPDGAPLHPTEGTVR